MNNATRTALYVALGAMAFGASEAGAQTCRTGQTKSCITSLTGVKSCWCVGSEVCEVTVDGNAFLGTIGRTFTNGEVSVTCGVRGFDIVEGQVCLNGENPEGNLTCESDNPIAPPKGKPGGGGKTTLTSTSSGTGNKAGQYKHDCRHVDLNGHLDPNCAIPNFPLVDKVPVGDLNDQSAPMTCVSGICTGSAEIQLTETEVDYCPDGFHPNFTANQFIAYVNVAVNDANGTPPASRVATGYQMCTLSGSDYRCVDIEPDLYCYGGGGGCEE